MLTADRELEGTAALDAITAAFARLPAPQKIERVTVRSVDFTKSGRRIQMKVVFRRGNRRQVEDITFAVSSAWLRTIRGRVERALEG